MYEFQYDYVKRKYGENAKLCYIDTDGFIVHDDIYKDITAYVQRRFDTSNFELDRSMKYIKGKNRKLIGLMKDEFGGQIMKEYVGLRAKTCSYLKNNDENKIVKSYKKVCCKKKT